MDVIEALRSRTSIRAYLDTPISKDEVAALLEEARWSPSGGNMQPWKVIAVAGSAKDAVIEAAATLVMRHPQPDEDHEYPVYPKKLWEPFRTRRYQLGELMYQHLGIPREDKPARLQWVARNFAFFGAPVGLFFVIDKNLGRGQWAHLGMFMQSLALVATHHGLATCMQESWGMVRQTLHQHFELPEHEVLYCGMALGHPDLSAEVNRMRSPREPVDSFAQFVGFDTDSK